MTSDANAARTPRPPAGAVRMFGRYQLLRLLGKSERSMAWAAVLPGTEHEVMLAMPRRQPSGAEALDRWTQTVQRAARVSHPALAEVEEVGVQDGWPFIAVAMRGCATWADRLSPKGWASTELAPLALQLLQGLAFAHDAGVAHRDLQPFLVLVADNGALRLVGLEIAADEAPADASALVAQRAAAERDVLAAGVLMHHALAGAPALDEPDVGRVVRSLPPLGRDIVRLPWTLAHPVPEALRAIVNRATDRQERQRYRSARTLARALEGWVQSDATEGGGPLALLGDKLRAAGVLPSQPGAAAQAARLALMETQSTQALAEVVLQDPALAFELLRVVNSGPAREGQLAGSAPVLTVRRAIAMIGLDGLRRAALALRPWPGPLDETQAADLMRLIARVKRAARIAIALRPAGYDAEVVYLITLLQNLGRLVVEYHFAEEAAQIRRLMLPAPAARAGEPDDPGMSEEGAAYAVLGCDIEAIGAAVARYWGLDDAVLTLIRRLPADAPVHTPENDDEVLRTTASCGNEAVDALGLPPARVQAALQRLLLRHGRALGFGAKELQQAIADSALERSNPLAVGDEEPVFASSGAAQLGPPSRAREAGGAEAPVVGLRNAMAARAAARSGR